jgi:outer membrane protein TolC
LYNKYRTLQATLDLAAETMGFNREQSKLAELNEERELLRYKSGNVPFNTYLEARVKKAEVDVASLGTLEERVISLIELATLAGGLNKYNARIRF